MCELGVDDAVFQRGTILFLHQGYPTKRAPGDQILTAAVEVGTSLMRHSNVPRITMIVWQTRMTDEGEPKLSYRTEQDLIYRRRDNAITTTIYRLSHLKCRCGPAAAKRWKMKRRRSLCDWYIHYFLVATLIIRHRSKCMNL